MLKYLKEPIKHVFNRYPLIANCVTYGMFTSSAEFLQQSINIHDQAKAENGSTMVSIKHLHLYIHTHMYNSSNA